MKIAITGHKRGIGKAFADQLGSLGHQIIGISRSDGENIRRTVHTASIIEPCDMWINNAISFYAQTELLFEVWHRWQPSQQKRKIWNISTKAVLSESQLIDGLTMRQSMQYWNQKMSLELAHNQLSSLHSNIEMLLIRPGAVNTQAFSHPDSILPDQFVNEILLEQGMIG